MWSRQVRYNISECARVIVHSVHIWQVWAECRQHSGIQLHSVPRWSILGDIGKLVDDCSCLPGQYQSAVGQTICINCVAGTYLAQLEPMTGGLHRMCGQYVSSQVM